MGTLTSSIDEQNRIDELTEWCRNKPKEAALRIMEAENIAEHRRPYRHLSREEKRQAIRVLLDSGLL